MNCKIVRHNIMGSRKKSLKIFVILIFFNKFVINFLLLKTKKNKIES